MAGHDSQSFYPSFTSKGLDTSTGQVIDLGALYDKQKRLASDFKIPKTYAEAEEIYGPNLAGASETVKGYIMENLKKDIPEGKEIIKLKGKNVIVDKDRPKNFARFVAGIKDIMSGYTTDYDKLGSQYVDDGSGKEVYKKFGTLEEFDLDDKSKYLFSPTQQQVIKADLTDKFGEVPSPTEGLKDSLEAINLYQENQDARQLKKARRMALDSFGTYAATEIPRQMFINRAAEIANERFLRTKFALEATPTKIQDIMTAKQAQQGIAALSEAERAKAVAEQQKAANEFGAPQVTLARNVRFANAAFKA